MFHSLMANISEVFKYYVRQYRALYNSTFIKGMTVYFIILQESYNEFTLSLTETTGTKNCICKVHCMNICNYILGVV